MGTLRGVYSKSSTALLRAGMVGVLSYTSIVSGGDTCSSSNTADPDLCLVGVGLTKRARGVENTRLVLLSREGFLFCECCREYIVFC